MNLIVVNSLITVEDFLSGYNLKRGFTSSNFLDIDINQENLEIVNFKVVDPKKPLTNRQIISSQWIDEKDLQQNVTSKTDSQILIRPGTQVGLPNEFIFRDDIKEFPDKINTAHSKAFLSGVLKRLFENPNYQQRVISNNKYTARKDINSGVSVYIWSRALFSNASGGTGSEGWLDVTKDIDEIRTSVNGNGGSFNFSLPPISAVYKGATWQKNRMTGVEIDIDNINDKDPVQFLNSKSAISARSNSAHLNSNDFTDPLMRVVQFYQTVLQENDLVYIRFEKLKNESQNEAGLAIKDNLENYTYDMIGLIDNISQSTTPTSIQTVVSGRDLSKVLIEDGSIFFPEQLATNIFQNKDSLLAKRNIMQGVEGELLSYASSFKTIEVVLKFIFNKFSNIGYVPNLVLYSYNLTDAEKSKYKLKSSVLSDKFNQVLEQLDKSFNQEKRQGVWNIMNLVLDPSISDRVIVDSSIGMDNGSIINSINKVCQKPFVEFFGDTYDSKFYFTVRKPPFDFEGYSSLVYGLAISDETIFDNTLSKSDLETSVKIKRKPLKDPVSSTRQYEISELVIDIEEVDVLSDSLVYHDEAYSWYRLIPRGLGEISQLASFQLAPVVSFDEYAEVWGNKTYSIEDNYCPSAYLDDSKNKQRVGYAESQAWYDLQYIIQSNAYLPFTRRGSIAITGNRLIKRGYFIYYKPTDEIFYVDSVTQMKNSNNRQTILQVSRGMRRPFIQGIETEVIGTTGKRKVNISYFNIVNTEIDTNASINNTSFLKNWKVNKDVFDFFIQRKQWADLKNL